MKIKISLLLIIIAISQIQSKKKDSHTPQGINLQNHYGLSSAEEKFGPKNDNYDHYVESNPDTFVPFKTSGRKAIENALEFKPHPGDEKKLNPHFIKSGEMSNIAPSASKIVSPQIAAPIVHVKAKIEYPAIVRYPTFYGMKKDWQNVKAYNKETGQLVNEKVLVERPQMAYEDHVSNIVRDHEQFVDLRSGKRINSDVAKVNHGIESKNKRRFI